MSSMESDKIVVFGGAGFLGSHVCDKLSDAGYRVVVYDAVPSPWLRPDQSAVVGDILDESLVRQTVENSRCVFNFAGIADIGEASQRPVDTVRYNILGNTIILNACKDYGVERYVFASSVYVYSDSGGFYRCSKQASELYIEEFQSCYGLSYTILRYGSLYGPRSDNRNAIHRFVQQALCEKKITYVGSPDSIREYIHVEDAALSSVETLKPAFANQRIILTGNQPMRIGDLFKMITEVLGSDIKFEFIQNSNSFHYEITPYSFSAKMAKKFTLPLSMDLGQGVLRTIESQYQKLHPELTSLDGFYYKKN